MLGSYLRLQRKLVQDTICLNSFY